MVTRRRLCLSQRIARSHTIGGRAKSKSTLSEKNDPGTTAVRAPATSACTLVLGQDVDLSDNAEITDAGVAHIAKIPGLRSLSLRGTKVGDEGLASLTALSGVERLGIDRTPVTESGLALVPTFTKLTRLGLSDLPVTGESLAPISRLPRLQELALGGASMRLTAGEMSTLVNAQQLKRLVITDAPQVTDTWLAPLAKLASLPDLGLLKRSVTADGGIKRSCIALRTRLGPQCVLRVSFLISRQQHAPIRRQKNCAHPSDPPGSPVSFPFDSSWFWNMASVRPANVDPNRATRPKHPYQTRPAYTPA
jgi:hypothetical protein